MRVVFTPPRLVEAQGFIALIRVKRAGKATLVGAGYHGVWQDDAAGVQRLVGLVALCPACHRVKHLGRSHVQGLGDEAIAHLMAVNDWSVERAEAYIDLVLDVWERRSRASWRLDLSWLAARVRCANARRSDISRMGPPTRDRR